MTLLDALPPVPAPVPVPVPVPASDVCKDIMSMMLRGLHASVRIYGAMVWVNSRQYGCTLAAMNFQGAALAVQVGM